MSLETLTSSDPRGNFSLANLNFSKAFGVSLVNPHLRKLYFSERSTNENEHLCGPSSGLSKINFFLKCRIVFSSANNHFPKGLVQCLVLRKYTITAICLPLSSSRIRIYSSSHSLNTYLLCVRHSSRAWKIGLPDLAKRNTDDSIKLELKTYNG